LYDACSGPKDHWWVEGALHNHLRQQNEQEYRRRLVGFFEECLSAKRGGTS
jgi:fermentation-respiration switch protein FrsA (DUF1100 family)